MPVTLMGLSPSELFPRDEAVAPLDARSPHVVGCPPVSDSSPPPVDSPGGRVRRCVLVMASGRSVSDCSTPGSDTSPESVGRHAGGPAPRPRCSPGVPASSGSRADRSSGAASSALLPWAFLSSSFPRPQAGLGSSTRRPSGVSIISAAAPPPLGGWATLTRSGTSSLFSRVWNSNRPWLMVSPRVPSHVTALREPSSGRSGLLPEPREK
jgi:hypothetical protein